MSIAFAYVAIYSQNYQSGVGSSVLESLTVEDVCFNSTDINHAIYSNQATVSIYNSGQVGATINGVFVDGNATIQAAGPNNFNFHIYLPVGQHTVLHLQGPYSQWFSGVSYDFKVTTMRGSSFDEKFKAP